MAKLSRDSIRGWSNALAELCAQEEMHARANELLMRRVRRMGGRRGFWIAAGCALMALAATGMCAQEQSPAQPSQTPTLKTGITYEDQSSESCEKQNENNPYTGMD